MTTVLNIAIIATQISPGELPQPSAGQGAMQSIMSIFFGIIGAFALLVITISGLRYITANGDAGKITQAKNGIVYAVVGLAVSISAEAIVAFVGSRL